MPLAANTLGILLLGGPTLMVWGTDEQKERYLPPILSAEEIWCQGFSEPDAGSDLAAVKTRAVKDGDEWVVTGQKVWTSGAQYSKWCMLVARTDTEVAKHKGLTYFLMDMEQDAVQVRPLRQITGEAEFNELFIEEARIPDANVVGGVGNGWKVALTTLMNERAGLGFALQIRLRQLLDDVLARGGRKGLLEDPLYADELADIHVRCESIRLLAWKGLTDVERYGQPGPEGSLVKWLWSDTNQRLTQLAADMIGAEALTVGTSWSYELLRARGQHDRGGHHRGAQEHRRRARARAAAAEGGGVDVRRWAPPLPGLRRRGGLEHGLRLHRRPARDPAHRALTLLAERAGPSGCASTPRRGRTDAELWRELCELGWPGIAISEEYGGQGLGRIELSILCEELGRALAPVPFLPSVLASTMIEHAGSPEQRERWLPGLASGEAIGALGSAPSTGSRSS